MNAHVITFAPDGTGHCLWTEALPLHKLGQLDLQRASKIEFNASTQEWEVKSLKGQLLYSHRSRAKCLAWEQQHFNR